MLTLGLQEEEEEESKIKFLSQLKIQFFYFVSKMGRHLSSSL